MKNVTLCAFTSHRPDVLGGFHHEERDSCVFTSRRPDVLGVVHHDECDSCVFASHGPDVSGVAHHEECESCAFTGLRIHEPYKSRVAERCPFTSFSQRTHFFTKV